MATTITITALIPVADGSEEMETVVLQDVLVRGGIDVTLASVGGKNNILTCSRGVKLVADATIEECAGNEYDLIVLPGGLPGAEYLRDCEPLINMLRSQINANRLYGAICASPAVVLQTHGLLKDEATAYPAFQKKLQNITVSNERVVVSKNCVTSQGPGTAAEMGVKLVQLLVGSEKADAVAKGLLL